MEEKVILLGYTRIFQIFLQINRTGERRGYDWIDAMVTGRWPVIAGHLNVTQLKLIGRNLCGYFGIAHRHNTSPKLLFHKLLLKFHPDKIPLLFGNKPLFKITYRGWYVSQLVGKFVMQALSLLNGGDSDTQYEFPIPIFTANFNPLS